MNMFYLKIFFFVFAGASAQAHEIKNFHKVSENIFRGAQPSESDLRDLYKMGVRTIINLREDPKLIESEKRAAEKLGMRFVSYPMVVNPWYRPSQRKLEEILSELKDPRNGKIFLHCRAGRDRTGISVGIYRVLVEGMSPKLAYKEMAKLGYKKFLFGYNCAFDEFVGNKVSSKCNLFKPQD